MRPVVVLALGTLLAACGGAREDPGDVPEAAAPAAGLPAETPPRLPSFASATYSGIRPEPVALADGLWEGEPHAPGGASRPRVGLVADAYARGTVEGYDGEVGAALLWESSGGSGTRLYLAAARSSGGVIPAVLVGDRVQVRRFTVEDGALVLEVVQAGPGDPACCPTQLAVRRFRGAGGELLEAAPEIEGTLSVSSTLVGTRWQFSTFGRDEPAPPGSDLQLSFAAEGMTGLSGCNRFQASWTEGEPGEIAFGPVARTLRACPDADLDLEDRFLADLARTRGYSFLGGRLALELEPADGHPSLLLFDRMD